MFGATVWSALGLVLLVIELRRLGPSGVRRFHDLDPDRARSVVDYYSSPWQRRLLLVWGLLNLLNGGSDLAEGEVLSGALALVASALLAGVSLLQRHNSATVLREAEHREIAPSPDVSVAPRDASERRRRRQRQFGAVAVAALLVSPVAFGLAALLDPGIPVVVGSVALAVGLLAGLGYGWATAWVYGDEQPAATSPSD